MCDCYSNPLAKVTLSLTAPSQGEFDKLFRRNPIENQAISGFSGQKSVPE